MSSQRLLEGEVVEPQPSVDVQRLRDSLARVTGERDRLLGENADLRHRLSEVEAPIAELRQKLEPFYRLLQTVWGDIEAVAPEAAESPTNNHAPSAKASPVWESWKQRLGTTVAKGIDALLVHGELNTQQLAMATGLNRKTITNVVVLRMHRAGLINKNGGRFSLKKL